MVRKLQGVNIRFMHLVKRLSLQRPVMLFIFFLAVNITGQLSILYFLPTDTEHAAAGDPVWKQLLITIIAGPIIETLIFQLFLIRVILKKLTVIEILAVLFSAILFGLWHSTNITFMAAGFISGLTLGTLYFVFRRKEMSPFIYLSLFHGGFNLVAMLVNNFILTSSP
ncbi:lysostaphin resistance A-like protein [Flavitalea antarctica]